MYRGKRGWIVQHCSLSRFPQYLAPRLIYPSRVPGPVKLDSPSAVPPPLSLSRVNRLLRPLRSSLVSFSQSLHRASTLPPTATSTATSHVTTFYRASKSSIDRHDSLDWKQTNKRKSTSNTHGQRKRLSAAGLNDVDSSPFKQLQRAKASRKTYGSKRALAPASSLSSTVPLSSSSYPSTSASSFPTTDRQRGISKSILKSRLEECFHSDSSPASGELSNLVNRTIHLFQAYDNILQLVYPPVRPGGGGQRRPGKVTSLVEISAREIGWEIESNIREWLSSGLDENSCDDRNNVDDVDHGGSPIGRRRATNHSELDASSSGDEEEEMTCRRTSTASLSMSRGGGVDDMSRGEQDLEASRLQDEAYESCPSHTYRYALPLAIPTSGLDSYRRSQ